MNLGVCGGDGCCSKGPAACRGRIIGLGCAKGVGLWHNGGRCGSLGRFQLQHGVLCARGFLFWVIVVEETKVKALDTRAGRPSSLRMTQR